MSRHRNKTVSSILKGRLIKTHKLINKLLQHQNNCETSSTIDSVPARSQE